MLGIPLAISSLLCFICGLIALPKTKKNLLIAITSLVCFTSVSFIFWALSLGSNILAGEGMASVVTLFLVPMTFPTAAAIGYLLRFIAERLFRRKFSGWDIIPWVFPVALCIIGIAVELAYRSESAVYHNFVADDLPPSLSNFQYWWQQVPGDCLFVVRFNLNPSEFDKILSRRKFEETADADEMSTALHVYYAPDGSPGFKGLDISVPKSPLVRMYHYSDDEEHDVPHIMNIFTNEARDTVLIVGDN